MYCGNCGYELNGEGNFCPKCGNIIGNNSKIWNQPKKKKSVKIMATFICIIIVLAGCAIGGVFYKINDFSYLALVRNEDGKYGYINEKGKGIIPCEWDNAYSFGVNGIAAVGEKTGVDSEGNDLYSWGFIDRKGKQVIPMKYDSICSFGFTSENQLLAVAKRIGTDVEGNPVLRWGFINEKGEEVIECKYVDNDSIFRTSRWSKTGLHIVAVQTGIDEDRDDILKYGVINRRGEEVIACGEYERIGYTISDNGLITAEKFMGIDDNGEEMYKWGCIDEKGNEVIPFQYESLYFGDNGLISAEKIVGYDEDGEEVKKFGFINEKGEEMIPFQFENAYPFSNGRALVEGDMMYEINGGYINENGMIVIPFEYQASRCDFFDKNYLAIVGKWTGRNEDGYGIYKMGLINSEGEKILPCEYEYIWRTTSDMYAVEKNEKYGCANRNGEIVIPIQYDAISGGHNSWIAVGYYVDSYDESTDRYRMRYVDEAGNTVLELTEEYIAAAGFAKIE